MAYLEDLKKQKQAFEAKTAKRGSAASALLGDFKGPSLLSKVSYADKVEISEDQQFLRQVAKQYGLHLQDVERMKEMFDKYDTDKSGEICREEFDLMFRELESIPAEMEIPTRVIGPAWKKVDSDESGSIQFEEFLDLAADLGLLG